VTEHTKSKKFDDYLSIELVQKMLSQFFEETQIPKKVLAEALGITIEELENLCSKNATQALIPKINLPLIHLYCKTKFEKTKASEK